MLGAAVSATSYEATTLLTGGQTNLESWAISTGSGATLGAVTAGVGELFAGGGEAAASSSNFLSGIIDEGTEVDFPAGKSLAQFFAEDAPHGGYPTTLTQDLTVPRFWGNQAAEEGRFATFDLNTPNDLGLPAGNSAEHMSLMTFKAGSDVYIGPTASGRAMQIYMFRGVATYTQL